MTATHLATLPFRDASGQHNGGMGARARTASWAGIGLLAAGLLARWPALTVGSSAVIAVVGGAVTVAGLRRPGPPRSIRLSPGQWLPWLAVGLALALWELALLLLGNNDAWPPLSRLAGPVTQAPVGRLVLTLVWLACGGWLLRQCGRTSATAQ